MWGALPRRLAEKIERRLILGGIVRLRRHYAARARQRHTRGAVQVHIG